jgi:flagellar basal body-associated protein FliL
MTAANKEEDNEPFSQEDLDELISKDEQDESNSKGELDEPYSTGDLDDLLSEREQDEPDSKGELDEPISQEELDELISGDEQDEPDSKGELDEPISQEDLDELVAGDEQDEPDFKDELDEQIPAGELDESISQEELDKLVAGDELDESDFGDELAESISGDEQDESISGDELESEIEYEETTQEKDAEDRKEKYKGKNKPIVSIAGNYKRKRKLFIASAIGLCLLTGAGYLSLQNKEEKAPEAIKLPVMAGRSLVFDSFVIPFREHDKFAYLSLDISFRLMDRALAEEMTAKRNLLRGIIYDILREEVNKTAKLPPLDELKEHIIEGVNKALSSGKVKEAYVVDFLAV